MTDDFDNYLDSTMDFYNKSNSFIVNSSLVTKINQLKAEKALKAETKLNHAKKCQFLALGLERLPFLYFDPKVEDYMWTKIAYDLAFQGNLIPDIVRYQVGPTFFISFGNVANQIKREFYLLLLSNKDVYVSNKKNDLGVAFYTEEAIRTMILAGDRNWVDFSRHQVEPHKCQTDWYHRWGWVYETNWDSYRAIDMKVSNYMLELSVLEHILKLKVQYASVPGTGNDSILKHIIIRKMNLIKTKLIPEAEEVKAKQWERLTKVKRGSQKYYDILHY